MKYTTQDDYSQDHMNFPLKDEGSNAGVRLLGLSEVRQNKGQGSAMTAPHVLTTLPKHHPITSFLSETNPTNEAELSPTESMSIDSEAFPRSEPPEWINLNMASKLPNEGQEEAHSSAIGKAERRKVSNSRVAEKMAYIDARKAERMKDCCSVLVVREYADKRLRIGSQTAYCSNRFCASCAHRRSMRLIHRYTPILKEFRNKRWRYHVVLTYKNESKPMDRKRISRDLRNFHRSAFWRPYKLAGGLYSIEVTYNALTETFHTHIHLLVFTENKPIPCIEYGRAENIGRFQNAVNEEMSNAWYDVTGTSSIVYGGKVKGGVFEVLKYITKFQSAEDGQSSGIENMPQARFNDLYTWTVGSRIVSAFGGLYGKVSKAQEMEDEEATEEEEELKADYGNEAYIEYRYEFRDRLQRMVIVAMRNYNPAVSRTSYTTTFTE